MSNVGPVPVSVSVTTAQSVYTVSRDEATGDINYTWTSRTGSGNWATYRLGGDQAPDKVCFGSTEGVVCYNSVTVQQGRMGLLPIEKWVQSDMHFLTVKLRDRQPKDNDPVQNVSVCSNNGKCKTLPNIKEAAKILDQLLRASLRYHR